MNKIITTNNIKGGSTMATIIRTNKVHAEDWNGFVMDYAGNDIAKKIKAITSSKRYHKAYRKHDAEAQMSYENKIAELLNSSSYEFYEA